MSRKHIFRILFHVTECDVRVSSSPTSHPVSSTSVPVIPSRLPQELLNFSHIQPVTFWPPVCQTPRLRAKAGNADEKVRGEVHAHHQQTPRRLTNIPEEEEGRSGGGSANPSPTHTQNPADPVLHSNYGHLPPLCLSGG